MSRPRPRRWGVVALVLLGVGCRSADPAPVGSLVGTAWEIDGPKATGLPPADLAAFDCDRGVGFVIVATASTTGASEAIDLLLPNRRQRLPRVPTASGARYSADGISVWNKGREAILDMDGHVYKCRETTRR